MKMSQLLTRNEITKQTREGAKDVTQQTSEAMCSASSVASNMFLTRSSAQHGESPARIVEIRTTL